MISDISPKFQTFDDQTEFQLEFLSLFDQDYQIVFGYVHDASTPDYGNPLYEKHRRAHIVLKWIMGVGSDSAVYMSHFRTCLGTDVRGQLDDFLYSAKDLLPEYWRERAKLLHIYL